MSCSLASLTAGARMRLRTLLEFIGPPACVGKTLSPASVLVWALRALSSSLYGDLVRV